MACDAMSVRLHLPQIRVLGVLTDTAGEFVVEVESTLRSLRCPQCGFKCHRAGRPSNGRIEGTNNLLQVLRRTAHGFTNPRNFEARGILTT